MSANLPRGVTEMSGGRYRVRKHWGSVKAVDEVFYDRLRALAYNADCEYAKRAGKPFPAREPERPVAAQSLAVLPLGDVLDLYVDHCRYKKSINNEFITRGFTVIVNRIRKHSDTSVVVARMKEGEVVAMRDSMMATGIGKSTQNATIGRLRQCLDWVRDKGWDGDNPAQDVEGVDPDVPCMVQNREPVVMWNTTELMEILRAGSWRDRVPMALQYFEGLRPGELLGLNLDDVDLDQHALYVRAMGGGAFDVAEGKTADRVLRTKNPHSRRRVLVPDTMAEVLYKYILEVHGIDMSAPLTSEQRALPLFLGSKGGRLSNVCLNMSMSKMLRATGWDYDTVGFKVSLRHLRKCARMTLKRENVDGQAISTWMGHLTDMTRDGSALTTLTSYSGPHSKWETDVLQAWDNVIHRDVPNLVDVLFEDARDDEYLPLNDAAQYIGVSLKVVENWVTRRRISYYRADAVGRFEGIHKNQLVVSAVEAERMRAEVTRQVGTLSVDEFAVRLGVPPSAVYRWIHRGLVPTVIPAGARSGEGRQPQHLIQPLHVDRVRDELADEQALMESEGVHVLSVRHLLGVTPKQIADWRRSGVLTDLPTPYSRLGSHVTKESFIRLETAQATIDPTGPGRWMSIADAAQFAGRSQRWMNINARRSFVTRSREGVLWVWVPEAGSGDTQFEAS